MFRVKLPCFGLRETITVVAIYKVVSISIVAWIFSRQAIPLICLSSIDIAIAGYVIFVIREKAKRIPTPPPSPAPPRHTHATINGLEDGIAILIDILKETEISLKFIRGRADDLLAVLQQVRQGPGAYKEQPTKIIRRKRTIE